MMAFTPIAHSMQLLPLHHAAAIEDTPEVAASDPCFSEPVSVGEIHDGKVIYPLREKLGQEASLGTYTLEGFSTFLAGKGTSVRAAEQDFRLKLHEKFQEVWSKPDFERTPEQRRVWDALALLIDTARYERLRTVTTIEMGRIVTRRGHVRRILWASGRKEAIPTGKAPAAFSILPIGRWFEAVVRRENLTNRLVEIEHLTPISRPIYSQEERAEFWRGASPG